MKKDMINEKEDMKSMKDDMNQENVEVTDDNRENGPDGLGPFYINSDKAVDEEWYDDAIYRPNIWRFHSFFVRNAVWVLSAFINVAELKDKGEWMVYLCGSPSGKVGRKDLQDIMKPLVALERYYDEGEEKLLSRKLWLEGGDRLAKVSNALHRLVSLLPYLNERHFKLSEKLWVERYSKGGISMEELRHADLTLARLIYPTFHDYMLCHAFVGSYYRRLYTWPRKDGSLGQMCDAWDKALRKMDDAWLWLATRKVEKLEDEQWEEVPDEVYRGLHLFAEHLPDLQND